MLILGVDGFIGNALGERLLESGDYEVHGMDIRSDYLEHLLDRLTHREAAEGQDIEGQLAELVGVLLVVEEPTRRLGQT